MSYELNYTIGSIPLEKLKPKKVRKNIELTLWERLYIPEIVRGMIITTRHFVQNMAGFIFPPNGKKRRVFTVYYPEEKLTIPIAYRGRPVLVMREDGTERCVACGLCESICPAFAISIVGGERRRENEMERYPVTYTLDMSRCVYCGFCEEVCPKEAIAMSDEYEELAERDRNRMIYPKEKLLVSEKRLKNRIDYVRKIYSKNNYNAK
ncbi:MAG: NADH-quinone oxidoreductase subunit I [Nitrospinae bacterium]|nr:NADH-quinone oxidoreductase subunit I [Nitrospinota bacterium]